MSDFDETECDGGYARALKAAGAVVHSYGEFGDYQGTWWARVTYNGNTGWIKGYYGSCSVCDAFEAEFGWEREETPEALADFGKDYLEDVLYTQQEAEEIAAENSDWDLEAEEMLKWIKTHREDV